MPAASVASRRWLAFHTGGLELCRMIRKAFANAIIWVFGALTWDQHLARQRAKRDSG
jgi:hypothetical protein